MTHYEGTCDHCGEWVGSLAKVENADAYLCPDCRGFDL